MWESECGKGECGKGECDIDYVYGRAGLLPMYNGMLRTVNVNVIFV